MVKQFLRLFQNSGFGPWARQSRAQKRSVAELHEHLSTETTPHTVQRHILKKPLLYQLAAISYIAFAASCASNETTEETVQPVIADAAPDAPKWFWDHRPSSGAVYFIGFGTRHKRREDEVYAALKEASVQAGVFESFWGASQDLVRSDFSGTDFNTRTKAHYNAQAADAALESLEVEDQWQNNQATWILFRLTTTKAKAIHWQPGYPDGEPDWIRRPPMIPGYHVTIGSGAKKSSLAKTLRGADVSALAAMIDAFHGQTKTGTITGQQSSKTWSKSSGQSETYDRGFGEVRGFLVISRWVDKKGNAWSLAISPKLE